MKRKLKTFNPMVGRYAGSKASRCALLSILLIAWWSAAAWSGDATAFDFESLNRLLGRVVDSRGWVDYAAIKAEPNELRLQLRRLREVSPESHPAVFPRREDRLAYWINAYNTLVISGVVNAYPVTSVKSIHPQPGFFKVYHVLGGKSYSLDEIEHKIIRKRFGDPRIHAALNCAAASCPALRPEAFRSEQLENQLEAAVRDFILDPLHVKVDRDSGTLILSKILEWFEGDFIGWYKRTYQVDDARITDYLKIYLAEQDRSFLDTHPRVTVRYLRYDWTLNDRALHQDAIR